ncbi:hypothetical protein [Edaphobacter aggregans]|uniref:hypothetical protein n=1 Tax=Edaphobacter aggregans TaxID=570835 RepID=UPI0006912A84|nr:hypothetical protein [Edaphobacter aggregans]
MEHTRKWLSAVDAAPLMCAGVTTFNCLRNTGARPGDLVAVLGLGGLGHLGRQYAAKMGFRTVATARRGQSRVREEDGRGGVYRQPGAGHLGRIAEAGRREGCAGHGYKCECDGDGDGRAGGGCVHDVDAVPKLEGPSLQILLASQEVQRWYSGTAADSEDGLNFSLLEGVRSMNEVYKLTSSRKNTSG